MATLEREVAETSQQPFKFDYEDSKTVEGRGELRTGSRDLAALRLERCLEAMEGTTGRLLEIGCGAGRYTRAFLHYRPDLDISGCDISHLALDEARAADSTDAIHYEMGDALNLPYADSSFDIVLLFDVFEHVTDVGRAADEVARVLKPGGVFHCFVPCEGNKRTIFAVLRHSKLVPIHRWKRDHIGHIQILTTGGICGIFWSHGLPVTDVSFSFHLLGQIHDVVDYWRREQLAGGRARSAPARAAVRLFSRAVFYPTWRLAYYEDRARMRDGRAIGVHITATKKGSA